MSKTSNSDKYRNIFNIKWSQDEILKIIIERIKYAYYSQNITYPASDQKALTDVFPAQVGTKNLSNWLFERTFGRPRDIIQIARLYTEKNINSKPDQKILLKKVDPDFSEWKLNDLCTEYLSQYKNLNLFFDLLKFHLKGKPYSLSKLVFSKILDRIFADQIVEIDWLDSLKKKKDRNQKVLLLLYDLYFIGDRISTKEIIYKSTHRHKPAFDNIDIHPAFRSALSLIKKSRAK